MVSREAMSRQPGVTAFCTVLVVGGASAGFIPSFAGPYIAVVEHLGKCSGVETDGSIIVNRSLFSHFNPVKPFDPQHFDGFGITTVNVTDTAWIECLVSSRSNNQWKANALKYKFPGGGCSNAREHFPNLFYPLLGHAVKPTGPCVIPPGTYSINQTVEVKFPHFPAVPYGHYRTQMTVGPRGRELAYGCFILQGHLIPRPN